MFAFIFRIFLLVIAASVIRSVVGSVLRAFKGATGVSPAQNATRPAADPLASPGPDGSTLLHQDPVCGTYVAAGSSLRKICQGKVYHFCSDECRDRYVA